MKKKQQVAKPTPERQAQVTRLGLNVLVNAQARVRSGCSRDHTGNCGINYRGG